LQTAKKVTANIVTRSFSSWCDCRKRNVVAGKIGRQLGVLFELAKGRKDRNVMLSSETLDLLRQWWMARPSRHDAQTPVPERWLFPGTRGGKPMTTRQLNRLFHEAADAVAISNRRLVALDDNGVTFKWKDYRIEGPE
jgi:integrase